MNLLEICTGWEKLEFWNQVGVASGVIAIVLAILALAGVQVHLIDLSIWFLLCGFVLLVYGNIQQSRKLSNANDELSKVDGRIDQATTSVYTQKNKEIGELRMEVAAWKDKAAGYQEERTKAEQLLQSERDKFNVERDKLVSECRWLYDELARAREQKIQGGYKFYFTGDEIQKTGYVAGGLIVDDKTPGEKRFGEIEAMLKKRS